jgi:hypothetical protein
MPAATAASSAGENPAKDSAAKTIGNHPGRRCPFVYSFFAIPTLFLLKILELISNSNAN